MKKTIKQLFFTSAFLCSSFVFSQVSIGVDTPNVSAMLEVSSTTKGFLLTRLTKVQKASIVNPATGLIIWCSDCGTSGEAQVYNGTLWTKLNGENASASYFRSEFTKSEVVWNYKSLYFPIKNRFELI